MPGNSDLNENCKDIIRQDFDDTTSPQTAEDAVVNNTNQKKILDQAQECNNQDSISELQMKALNPSDRLFKVIEANRFEITDEIESLTNSELQLKTIEQQTKDPVLRVIQGLVTFVRGLAKGSPERETLNELRRAQQKERLEQIVTTESVFNAPLALAAPEKAVAEHENTQPKEVVKSLPPSKLHLQVGTNVSQEFQSRVDYFARQIPSGLQESLIRSGVGITVYAHSSDVPSDLADQHARGHSQDQLTKNLPMFYEARSKSIVFIEKPDLTPVEQNWKDDVEYTRESLRKKGIQDFGSLRDFDAKAIRYAPIERSGWHELGHAIDIAVLGKLSESKEFDALFRKELASLTAAQLRDLSYFVQPDNTVTDSKKLEKAKQEAFAEMVLTLLINPDKQTKRDLSLREAFPETFRFIKQRVSPLLH